MIKLLKLLINLILWFVPTVHKWRYHNPHNRRCTVCDRHEVSHCESMETWFQDWWEVFNEGDKTKHRLKV